MLMISHFLSRILSFWFITLFQRSGFNELENVRWKMLKQNKKNSSVEEIVKRKRSVNSDLRRLWVLKLIARWFASISIEIRRQWLWCSRVKQIVMFVIRMTFICWHNGASYQVLLQPATLCIMHFYNATIFFRVDYELLMWIESCAVHTRVAFACEKKLQACAIALPVWQTITKIRLRTSHRGPMADFQFQ